MNNRREISVAVPTCQRADYLHDCLDSIFNQTIRPDEIVISEDGEDKATESVVKSFFNRGVHIIYHRNQVPLKQLGNRNKAFHLTTGTFVAMLDDDDQWEPEFIEKNYNALSDNPECDFSWSDHIVTDQDGNILPKETHEVSLRSSRGTRPSGVYPDTLEEMLTIYPYSLQNMLFKRETLEKVGFFQPFGGLVPDLTLFLALGAEGARGVYVGEKLGRNRIHPGQQTARRVENSESKVDCFRGFIQKYGEKLTAEQIGIVKAKYRDAVVEVAIARAHQSDRVGALGTIREYSAFGFGMPNIYRMVVLMALMIGFNKKPSKTSMLARKGV